ncbi:MAG: cytochrome b [Alcaligenaceae bacterium]|nr:cytochrome b [Alcaligenaceae bacterium]
MSDTPERYGRTTRYFHWGMAVLFLWQFLKFFDRIDEGEHWVGQTLVPWHISVGTLLLVLGLYRVYWALKQRGHRPHVHGMLASLATIGHFMLYLVMVLLPIAGILLMVGNGYGLKAFGMQLVAKSETEIAWMAGLGELHSPLAWLFLILVVGHIVAALYHHFVERDDTLTRIWS